MFLIISKYIKVPALTQPHQQTHLQWVTKYADEQIFLFGGPKKDKSGGIIIVKDIDKDRLAAILAEDSYVEAGIIEYEVTDFDSVISLPGLAELIA